MWIIPDMNLKIFEVTCIVAIITGSITLLSMRIFYGVVLSGFGLYFLSLLAGLSAASQAAVPSSRPLSAPPQQVQAPFDGQRVLEARLKKSIEDKDFLEAHRVLALYERHFPRSPGYPQALYQTGLMEFRAGMFGEALRTWTLLERRFPSHPLAPAALLGKATAYDKLELKNVAYRVRSNLVQRYPQSQQGLRARAQLQQVQK